MPRHSASGYARRPVGAPGAGAQVHQHQHQHHHGHAPHAQAVVVAQAAVVVQQPVAVVQQPVVVVHPVAQQVVVAAAQPSIYQSTHPFFVPQQHHPLFHAHSAPSQGAGSTHGHP